MFNELRIYKKLLRILYYYPCQKILEEKNVKKTLCKTFYLILFYLNSFLVSNTIMHDYVSRGAEPESELQLKT